MMKVTPQKACTRPFTSPQFILRAQQSVFTDSAAWQVNFKEVTERLVFWKRCCHDFPGY